MTRISVSREGTKTGIHIREMDEPIGSLDLEEFKKSVLCLVG